MNEIASRPPQNAFRPEERRLIRRLSTPARVQRHLNGLPYNDELKPLGETLRTFRGVVKHGTAHCLEAALFAAVVLEHYGYAPQVLSFESIDKLEHVIFAYQKNGKWGSIARSRDPGLHGRKPVFATPRALAKSYFDPYVDQTGCVTAFAVVDLDANFGNYDWRLSEKNVWKVERMLIDYPHEKLPIDRNRVRRLRARYRAFCQAYPGRKPLRYAGRIRWTALPDEFMKDGYDVGWVD
jgi:hypothetical protein